MSSATQSNAPSITPGLPQLVSGCIERLTTGVRAAAFWAAALLPLVVIAGLATGLAGQYPEALAGALALNAVCAVVGHGHAPQR
ncbi:hypothetical protein [Natronomonas gomsonensis]|uniref:hypothetical protein n=1 Tax=Natronomonas gomsonensis TaxID=1046043 RepID=UPI0015BE4783|nr:hypothetical protein [Natronomonas gomsonensis]